MVNGKLSQTKLNKQTNKQQKYYNNINLKQNKRGFDF